MKWVVAICVAFQFLGCADYVHVRELPAYGSRLLPPSASEPLVYWADTIDDSFPTVVPFAILTAPDIRWAHDALQIIRHAAKKENAEVVFLSEGASEYTGSVGIYWGYGISTSQPTYSRSWQGICCNVARATLGIITRDDGLVMVVPEKIRECGLQEGDTLLSANGIAWSNEQNSSLWQLYAKLKPGDSVNLIWLRPEKGRMEGTAHAIENGSLGGAQRS